LRLLHPTLRSSYDVVVIPKPSIIGQSFWTIHETLQQKLRSIGLVTELEKS
jgi:RNase P protein component